MVDDISLEQQQCIRAVRLEPVLELFGIEERVPGCNYPVHREPTRSLMVGVQPIAPPGIVCQHDCRPQASDHHADRSPRVPVVEQFTVGSSQEHHLPGGSEGHRGGSLFALAARDEGVLVDAWIPRSLGTIGENQVLDGRPRACPPRQGGAALEFGVVGMCCDHHRARRRIEAGAVGYGT